MNSSIERTNAVLVAIDCEHYRQSAAGTARCTRSLTAALRRRDDVRLLELGGGPVLRRGTLRKRLTTLRQDFWWYPFHARRLATRAGAHLQHFPTPRAPITRSRPAFVVTVHDLASIRFPESLTPWTRLYERATLPHVVRAAERVIAPSKDTADDLQILLRVPASKIRVVPNGVDEFFFAADEAKPLLFEPYVLFVGTPQPRKNLSRLAAAVRLLRSRGFPHRLVVAGGEGWGNLKLEAADVNWVGYVSDADLRSLYTRAACLAIPSLHEGFGLPALEAMAAGTPVVASQTGALPEVTGGAAVLVDPLDAESIAEGIAAALARRAELTRAGYGRARLFTWSDAAEKTARVYHELV